MSYTYRDRDRDWDEPRSSGSIKRYVIPPEDERDVVVRRPADWDDSHSGTVSRYERDLDYDSRHYDRDPYEPRDPVNAYPRDSDYDFVDREPGYYYHRRVREYDDDRPSRRELSPADSVSQAGRGRRHRDRDYSSDDSMVHVRKDSRERDEHGEHLHHRRHMAEGALVGVGAAELLRNRKKSGGDEVSDGVGRIGQDVGAGALGAVAVEAASRARDYYRSRSRPRARSRSYDDDDRSSHGSRHHRHHHHRRYRRSHGHRSRSRARSHSRTKTLAGLGIGAAAIAAGVALANRNHGKSNDERRSRSRHRHHRSSRRSATEDGEAENHHRSESQRKKHMAGAGLAGAAAAGLLDRAHSRSRSRSGRARSHSKIRQALPIIAGGLGAAGVTGLYEKNKEKKDEERSRTRERRHRSRSRSRASSDVNPDPARDSNNLIEYGDRPVHGSIPAANYYGRSPTPPGYYSDATDPVASDAAGYGSSRRRDRSVSRPGTSSDSSSDSDRGSRRRRQSRHGKSHHRSKKAAGAALAAAGVGYAAHKYSQHNKGRRSPGADRDKLRFEDEVHDGPYETHDPYDDPYNYMPYPPTPPPASRPIESHPPGPGFIPPPPGSDPRYAGSHPRPYPPPEYAPPPGAVPPPQPHGYPPPPAPEPYPPRSREPGANVSTTGSSHPPKAQYTHDGLRGMYSPPGTPRVRRRSQPFASRDHRHQDPGYEPDDSDSTDDSTNRKHRINSHRRRRSYPDHPTKPDRHYHARPSEISDNPPPSDSDSTIDLPDRFDSHGRPLPEQESGPKKNPLEDLLSNVFA